MKTATGNHSRLSSNGNISTFVGRYRQSFVLILYKRHILLLFLVVNVLFARVNTVVAGRASAFSSALGGTRQICLQIKHKADK